MAACSGCGAAEARHSLGGVMLCATCRPVVLERVETARAVGRVADASKEARALLRESAQTYLLRDIPADLWQQARHAAVDRNVSLRDLLISALRRDLDHPPAGEDA